MKHYKSVEVLSIFRMSSPSAQTQTPHIENVLATVLNLLLIHLLSTRSPILPKWNNSSKILTRAVAWPAQNCGWVKMFDFTWATVHCL